MGLKRKAASGVKWMSVSTAIKTIVSILQVVILAHFLSPKDFGLMAMALLMVGFADVYTDLGISAAIIYRQDATREQLSSLYWLNVISGLLVFGLAWVLIPFIVMFFNEPRLLPLLQTIALVFIITPLGKQFEILLQKELSFIILAEQEIAASFGGFVVAVICAILGFGVWTLVLAFFAGTILRTTLLIYIGLGRFRPSFHFRVSDLKGFIGFGMYQIGERTINYFSQQFDQILIGKLLGAQSLGFYNFAFNIAVQPISRINPIITKVAFPVFSKVQDDIVRLRNGYIKVVGFLTNVNAPLLVGIAAVAPIAVPLILGEKWSQSIILIQILSFVALLRSMGNPIGSLQLAKGRADLGFKWNVIFLLINIPAVYLGGMIGGGVGVAISLLIVQICIHIPCYLYLVRPLTGRCGREYARAILKPITLASLMGLIVIVISYVFHSVHEVTKLIIQVGSGTLAYLLLLWIFDREIIYEFRTMWFSRSNQTQEQS